MNILTKDIDIFVNGSDKFPYLVTVPINTILSAIFLFSMYHYIVLVCYLAMLLLLVMQYFTNNYIANNTPCQHTTRRVCGLHTN